VSPHAELDQEAQLEYEISGFQRDPLGYVLFAFPWGEGELEGHPGPREWQRKAFEDIGRELQANADLGVWDAVQMAKASGHGIGKSAFLAMLIMWAMSTFEDCRGVVTANTDTQLRTKTWPEVAKWHRLAINSHWFNLEATKIESIDPEHAKNWRIDIIPWSLVNTEAFAGLHNERKRIVLIFDEASAIADKIWEVAEGALTDDNTEIIWMVFGNPTRQTGRFRDCFGRLKHRWHHEHIDSRNVEGTNKAQIAKLVEDNGEDSDVVRVRVKGEFPLQAEYQLISLEHVANARRREAFLDHNQPIVAGLDFARSGSCETVLSFRCGRDASSLKWFVWRERDSVILAGKISMVLKELRDRKVRIHTVFCDGGGLGGPIIDMLTHAGWPTREVIAGAKATDAKDFGNKTSECWARMRDWMPGASVPDDPELETQLVSRNFFWDPKTNALTLVSKDKMIADGEESPDRADSLSLTFADFILPELNIGIAKGQYQTVNDLNSDPFGRD